MANTDNPRGFRPVTVLGGMTGVVPTWPGRLKSNQVAALGDALYATNGLIYGGTATTDKAIVGVMAERGHEKSGTIGSTTTAANLNVIFWPAADNIVFMGQTSGTMSQGSVWKLKDFEGAAGNSTGISNQEINEDATTNKNVYLVGINQGKNNSMGTWCEVLFTWAKNKFQARGAMVLSTQYIGY